MYLGEGEKLENEHACSTGMPLNMITILEFERGGTKLP